MKDEVPPSIVDAHVKTVVNATSEGKTTDPSYGLDKSGIAGTGNQFWPGEIIPRFLHVLYFHLLSFMLIVITTLFVANSFFPSSFYFLFFSYLLILSHHFSPTILSRHQVLFLLYLLTILSTISVLLFYTENS